MMSWEEGRIADTLISDIPYQPSSSTCWKARVKRLGILCLLVEKGKEQKLVVLVMFIIWNQQRGNEDTPMGHYSPVPSLKWRHQGLEHRHEIGSFPSGDSLQDEVVCDYADGCAVHVLSLSWFEVLIERTRNIETSELEIEDIKPPICLSLPFIVHQIHNF